MAENHLFVLGNGFDLAHGLPTKYIDFFRFVDGVKQRWQSAPESCAPYIRTIRNTLRLGEAGRENPWHNYFGQELACGIDQKTWIDFETAIRSLILQIGEVPAGTSYLHHVAERMYARQYVFPPRLTDMDMRLSADAPPFSSACRQLEKETLLFLYQELLRYAFCFELYLRFDVMEQAQRQASCVLPYMEELLAANTNREDPGGNFILSFNYTDLEKRYIAQIPGLCGCRVQHIHGRVRRREELEACMDRPEFQLGTPLILGFHNAEDGGESDGTASLWFEKFYQRILHGTGTEVYRWLESREDRLKTVVYGHSLDVSDADLIRRIVDASAEVEVWCPDAVSIPIPLANLARTLGRDKLETEYTGGKLRFRLVSEIGRP